MKVLGVKQFLTMKFDLMDIPEPELQGLLGKLPKVFIGVIYGYSGQGKTEFTVRLCKMLARMGMRVAWLSYEQGHGYDFQMACERNRMDEVSGLFYPIDPNENTGMLSKLEDLDAFLNKRGSPEVVVIDSLDYTGFSWKEYQHLKEKYGKRKTFIFLAHADKKGKIILRICERIIFDGGLGIFVKDYIAKPEKNRFGGTESYVIWEEEARKRNPAFFAKREKKPKDTGEFKEEN